LTVIETIQVDQILATTIVVAVVVVVVVVVVVGTRTLPRVAGL